VCGGLLEIWLTTFEHPIERITWSNDAAEYLYEKWLPVSSEKLRAFPIFFHYVNVGPNVQADEMITDVYLPLV
jgi:DNA gyrase inhibitor GyrI